MFNTPLFMSEKLETISVMPDYGWIYNQLKGMFGILGTIQTILIGFKNWTSKPVVYGNVCLEDKRLKESVLKRKLPLSQQRHGV